MRIVDVRVTGLRLLRAEGTWLEDVGVREDVNTIVEVLTDEGLAGVGSAGTGGAQVAGAMALLGPLLRGERADEPARVSEKLRQSTFWQGRGGPVEHAISGIDLALWDLMGKVTGQPVARLLGGRYRDRVQPYGSILFDPPETLRDRLQATVGRGFRALKVNWRPFGRRDRRTDERLVRVAREAVGPDVELMVDAGGSEHFWPHGVRWALETARMLADHGVRWFEEPLRPDDVEGYAELTRQSPVPVATGEVLTRRQAFRPFLERRAADVLQPDCTKCGGLTEAWQVGQEAGERGMLLVPHGWNTAVGLAADLHLVAALPVARYVEYLTPSPYLEAIVTRPFRLDAEGWLPVPDAPGLGVELDPDALRRFAVP